MLIIWKVKSVNAIQYGIYLRLLAKYKLESEMAKPEFLAAAVANKLLCGIPISEESIEFLENNKQNIESKSMEAFNDPEICKAAAYSVDIQAILNANNQDHEVKVNLLSAIMNFDSLGYKIRRKPVFYYILIKPFVIYIYSINFLGKSPK
jgi:hypothetical protein